MGQISCTVGLTWGENGSVSGYLDTGNSYSTLTGDNAAPGQINLTLKAPSGDIMTATLTKSGDGNSIVWSGTLHLSDGSTVPLSFSRSK